MKTLEQRKSILDKEIFNHTNHGWRVSTRSDTKCLLVRNRKPNGCLLTVLLLLFILPGLIYLYVNRGKSYLNIEVNQDGDVKYFTTGLTEFEKSELHWY